MREIIGRIDLVVVVGCILFIFDMIEDEKEKEARYIEWAKYNIVPDSYHWDGWKECDTLNRPNGLMCSIMEVIEHNTTVFHGREAWFSKIHPDFRDGNFFRLSVFYRR